jgi:TetR/AcrR family transcriptional regulator, transcriptional repressor for nem operon
LTPTNLDCMIQKVARSKEFDPREALKAAVDVFWRKGYEKTSLDDLMAGMNVGRQSLYDTFGDKRTLYLSALDEYRNTTQEAMRRLFGAGHPVGECFSAILFGICNESRADHERGCLLLSANLERKVGDKDIAALVRRNQAEVELIFEQALRAAQETGHLAPEKDPAALASFLLATIQGMRQAARAASDRTALERIARVALSTLD